MTVNLKDRMGVDPGWSIQLEDGIAWAARQGVRYIDAQLNTGDNVFTRFDDARAARIRADCKRDGIHLGLHTLSAVNVAEYSPLLSEAVDAYVQAYIEIVPHLGAARMVVQAGYHFTSDITARMQAGLERLQRMADCSAQYGSRILLENLSKEPELAEVHYLAHTLAEWQYYYEAIQSPSLGLSMQYPWRASHRYGWRRVSATATHSICYLDREISISPTCFTASKARASPAIT